MNSFIFDRQSNERTSFDDFISPKRRRFLIFAPLFLMLLACLVSAVSAQQQTSRPDRGFGGKGGYQSSDIDSISLQNGSVNAAVPLAALPPVAGGKLAYTLTAHYNSKLWNAVRGEAEVSDRQGCPFKYSVEDVQPADASDGAGWQIGGKYFFFFRDAHEDYDYLNDLSQICDGIEVTAMTGRFLKPMLRMPDGSEHELRLTSGGSFSYYQGDKEFLRGYLRDQSSGTSPSSTSALRLQTIDGSYITVAVPPFTNNPSSWTVYLKDGTKIEQTSTGQRTTDPNGNSLLQGHDATENYDFVKDEQTGRQIKWSAATYNSQTATKIEYQTVGGVWETTWVVWGTTTVRGKLYSKQDWNPQGGETGGGDVCYRYGEINQYTGLKDVIREIVLPATEQNQAAQKFTFGYNSDTSSQVTDTDVRFTCYNGDTPASYTRTASYGFGELSRITTPGGAEINYHYALDGASNTGLTYGGSTLDQVLRDALTSKTVTHDGATDTWTYEVSLNVAKQATQGKVTNPDGSGHTEIYNPTDITRTNPASTDGMGGLLARTNDSNKVITRKHYALLGGTTLATGAPSQIIGVNSVVDVDFTTLLDNSGNETLTKATRYQYDYNGELTQTIDYDWYAPQGDPLTVPTGAQILRVNNVSYYNQAGGTSSANAYQNRSVGTSTVILGAVQETNTGIGTTVKSQTRFSYDGQSYGTAPVKGNPTQVSQWNDQNNSWINSGIGYDAYGNVTSKTDGKGNSSYIYYEDSTHAMPTKTMVDPNNGTGQQITTATYDYSTGLLLTATDLNGNVSSVDYTNLLLGAVDPFGRAGTTYSPYVNVGGTNKRLTSKTYYEDAARKTRVESDLFSEGDALVKARESRDQLSRPYLSEKNENGVAAYTISTETKYGAPLDRTVMTSNPHRTAAAATDGWTRVKADILGRGIEASTFSGTAQPSVSGYTNSTGSVTTAYQANQTTVTDQAGKVRRSVMNGLGQLIRVDEPNDAGQLDASGTPVQSTNYVYDVLGNLTTVNQGSQTRTFQYDSLSRLKQAVNPESGTIAYQYDENGNLTQKTDARNVVTNYIYDALNRVTQRNYAPPTGIQNYGTTPAVTYTYDNLTNAKGKLTKVASTDSTTEYTGFDILGRVTGHKQTTGGNAYTTAYAYNLSGALIEETYPSGRVVRNTIDNEGALAQVQSKKNSTYGYQNYAGAFSYTAAGAVSSMRLGNGRWESTQFNSRLQPVQIALGNVQNATNLLKLDYTYNTTGNADNNGNVRTQTITAPTVGAQPGFTAVQSYSYDSLNRIKDATEMTTANGQSSSSQSWKQTFTYDRYGNRNFDTANNNTTTLVANCPAALCNPSVNTANNRLAANQGYGYDLAGNTTADAENRTFVYDGEGKQIQVSNSSGVIGQYVYDGDGKRVKKTSAAEETIFVYDAAGKQIAEYSTALNPTPQISYLTSDHLGSPRINTDQNGGVISRHDYQPFGEEIAQGRNTGLGYQADAIRKQFTSYERDIESDLDFAQARMYANKLGRFTSADPIMMTLERPSNPQELNLYSYVINNPFIAVDPSGEIVEATGDAANDYLTALQGAVGAKLKFAKDGKTVILDGKAPKNLTSDQKSLLGLITDKSFTLSVEATKTDDPNVLVDQYQGGGAMKVDFADLAKIVQPGATTKEEQAAHILVEANEGRKAGLKDVGATPEIHNKGIEAGNAVRKRQGLDPRSTQPEARFPTGIRASDGSTVNTIRYTVNYGSYTQYVYVKAETNSAKRELTPTGTIVASKVVKNTQPK